MIGNDYSVSSRYYPREMGEMIPPEKKAPVSNEYRPREMGESYVPSREEQTQYYQSAQTQYGATRPNDNYRPREMGETTVPQRTEGSEMTEQQRRLDLFA